MISADSVLLHCIGLPLCCGVDLEVHIALRTLAIHSVIAGHLRKQSLADIWDHSIRFEQLRDAAGLKGKCGCWQVRNVCMGCRARAFVKTGDFMAEEPFCM